MIPDVVKIILPAIVSFCVGILGAPLLSNYLYKYKLWKKVSVAKSIDGTTATWSQKIHQDDVKKTPRMGGILVWASVLVTICIINLVSKTFASSLTTKLDFLSRNQTWLPLLTLFIGSIVGLIDDYLVVKENGTYVGGGLSLSKRLIVVLALGLVGGWWFFAKLGVTSIIVPFLGEIALGYLFIPLFIVFMIGLYSGGIIDGVDGLAGGLFTIMYTAYAVIAYFHNQIDLAAFCMAIAGGLLAFLWFNIPPARFYLSETGTMGLTTTLVVVAFLTKSVVVLPVIAFPLVVTSASTIIQLVSKKFRNGKKVFLVAPLHNHFQARGWPPYKVTMRYWIVGTLFAIVGVIITLIG
jgi:phospho-N-acetylmuramoyl-pentapeptide-transferase